MGEGVTLKGRALIATATKCPHCRSRLSQLYVRFVKNGAEHVEQVTVCQRCDFITGVNT